MGYLLWKRKRNNLTQSPCQLTRTSIHIVKPSQFLRRRRLPDGSSVLIKQKEKEAQVSQGFNYFCLHPKWPTFQLLSKANPFGGPWVDFPRKDLKVPTLRASNQVPAFTPTDQPAVWVPSLSHSKEKERGPTMPHPLPDRIQKPRVSMCVDRLHPGSCPLVGSLAGCAVWRTTIFHKRWLWTMATSLLSEFLPQRRNRPMKRPVSCISGIPFQHISLRNNHYSQVAILLFLCIYQFRCKPTTHVVIHVNQMMRCTEWKRHTLPVHCGWIRPSWSRSRQYSPLPVFSCLRIRLRKFL